jgi:hypothetical protein
MTKSVARPILDVERRVERDLAKLPSTNPANALSGLIYDWPRDETWAA